MQINSAWCFSWEGLPRRPYYSEKTESQSLNNIGQVVARLNIVKIFLISWKYFRR